MKREKKEMNNKEGKEEPWKRRKKGMNNKEGKEEPSKRGNAKPEQRKHGWPIKWKRKNLGKISKGSLRSFFLKTFSVAFFCAYKIFDTFLFFKKLCDGKIKLFLIRFELFSCT